MTETQDRSRSVSDRAQGIRSLVITETAHLYAEHVIVRGIALLSHELPEALHRLRRVHRRDTAPACRLSDRRRLSSVRARKSIGREKYQNYPRGHQENYSGEHADEHAENLILLHQSTADTSTIAAST